MKWIKKILRIIAIILPVICCAMVSSGKSYAKQYTIDSFMAHGVSTYSNDSKILISGSPYVHFNDLHGSNSLSSYLDSLEVKPRNDSYLISHLTGENCMFESYHNPGYTLGTYDITWGYSFISSNSVLNRIPGDNSNLCMSYRQFGVSPIPSFSSSGVPAYYKLIVQQYAERGYNFLFSQFSFNGLRDKDGTIYSNNFSVEDLFKVNNHDADFDPLVIPYSIDSVEFGLNFDSSKENLAANSSVVIGGSFTMSSYGSISSIKILPRFVRGSSTSAVYSTCSFDDSVSFYCSIPVGESSVNAGNYGFTIQVNGSHVGTMRSFKDFYIILNNDSTPGGVGSFGAVGSLPNFAPGMPDLETDADYSTSLSSLFSFTILNPFQSIFNMFSDNDSCGSIPIIATMLHSNETTYCPWFSSNVRSVLTPVISMVSTMLLFGFFVSFLKSSTGNDVVDSGGHGSIYKGRLK